MSCKAGILQQARLILSCGFLFRMLVNLIKRKPQMTEEQIKTIGGSFTAMVEKCCKQADVEGCLGEEVRSISFFLKKQNTKYTHTQTTKATKNPQTKTNKKPQSTYTGTWKLSTIESCSANCCGHLSTCPYNKQPQLTVYPGCTDYSH